MEKLDGLTTSIAKLEERFQQEVRENEKELQAELHKTEQQLSRELENFHAKTRKR
jgi:hypothetical protein